MDQGGGGGGDGGYEAISAVQDDEEQFYGEDDDDYDDLYNDASVGEGFRAALHPPGAPDEPPPRREEEEMRLDQPRPPPPPPPQLPAHADPPEKVQIPTIAGDRKPDRPSPAPAAEPPFSVRLPPPPPVPPPAGIRPDLLPRHPAEIQGYSAMSGFSQDGFQGQGGAASNSNGAGGCGGGGGATLFVGELQWWTTDAELEAELCKYGKVKDVKYFDEKASGKFKGYCQVDFCDPMVAAACKEGMNGHIFNDRPCVVAFASPYSIRKMGEAQMNRNQPRLQQQQASGTTQRGNRVGGGVGGQPMIGGSFGRGGGGRGGGNWGRGGMGRGPIGGPPRNRIGGVGGRGLMGNGGLVALPQPPVLHPGAMLGQAFDPTGYGAAAAAAMGRIGGGGGYVGFPMVPSMAAAAAFPGMMPSYPPVVAPHVNPAFFGRGMPPGGAGMWPDPSGVGAWAGEDQSSYGEDAASDGEANHANDRVSDRDWAQDRRHDMEKDSGAGHDLVERRHRDERDRDRPRESERVRDRERDRERDRYKDERVRHDEYHRHRERDDDRDRGRSSGARSKPHEVEHSKRHRPTP